MYVVPEQIVYVPAVQLTHVPLESTNSGGPTDFKGCFARIDAASCLLDTERMANRVALLTPLLAWTAALLAAQWPASVMASEFCGPDVSPDSEWCGKCSYLVTVYTY